MTLFLFLRPPPSATITKPITVSFAPLHRQRVPQSGTGVDAELSVTICLNVRSKSMGPISCLKTEPEPIETVVVDFMTRACFAVNL